MTIEAVIDTSALIEFFTGAQPDPGLKRQLLTRNFGAPELVDIEVASTLRRLVRCGALANSDATVTLQDLGEAPIVRVTHRALLARIWDLRDTLTAYDASFVALAEQLAVPLLTCDGELARSHGHHASIELFPIS